MSEKIDRLIKAARAISQKLNYDEVIIVGLNFRQGSVDSASYGRLQGDEAEARTRMNSMRDAAFAMLPPKEEQLELIPDE